MTGPSEVADDPFSRTYSYYSEFYSGASYSWSVPSGWTINSGQGTFSIGVTAPANPNPGSITVSSTICTNSYYGNKYISVDDDGGPPLLRASGGGPAIFGPNPVVDNLKLIEVANQKTISNVTVTEMLTGRPVYQLSTLVSGESLSFLPLNPGYYQIKCFVEDIEYTENIIKE
ncbi:MAG: T9SS type A sorting domain-containing protein [Cyclobacteriaceae bacterium]